MRGISDRFSEAIDDDVGSRQQSQVCDPDDRPTLRLEPGIACVVPHALFNRVVRLSVEFDDQTGRHTDKVGDIGADRHLAPEFCADPTVAENAP